MTTRQHNSGTEDDGDGDGRKCWRTARERERLRARFHIRERVAANTHTKVDDDKEKDETTPQPNDGTASIADGNPAQEHARPIVFLDDPSTIQQIQQYITYTKSGDRSKFSLSLLDRHFDLVSSRIPISLLENSPLPSSDATTSAAPLSLREHSVQLCTAWFGLDYAQSLESYMDSLETFTLMEYAAWMGKYSIVGALLLAGINPCAHGRRRRRRRNKQLGHIMEEEDFSVAMGSRVSQRFFDCFPLALSTYIVKRVVELRRDAGAMMMQEISSRDCDSCGRHRTNEDDDHMSWLFFQCCHHYICEECFWNDLLEHIDHRGDSRDVILCPCCGKSDNNDSSLKKEFTLQDSSFDEYQMDNWDNLTRKEKRQKSLGNFESLPRDRQALKASSGKKKKPTERDQWASSWNEAVRPSLGSTQTVRRDKFFSFVERNSIHYVRGCLYTGVGVDWINEYGQSALYICAWRGYEEMARLLLLEFDANPTIAANDGSSPLEIASVLGHELVGKVMSKYSDGHKMEELFASPPFENSVFSSDTLQKPPVVLSMLIPRTTEHPGAGACTIDQALSTEQVDWLLSLHRRIPVDVTQKKKAGLCSERSYFCDASGMIRKALETTIGNTGLLGDDYSSLLGHDGQVQVFSHMRFLDYSVTGTTLNPHVDICRVDPHTGRRSTHTFILYLTDCRQGGETSLLGDVSGDQREQVLACVSPQRGRLLLFPHACPHEGNAVVDVPKILLRGEVFLSEK